jgi:V/A-type H+-transporting ATPase subunit A
VSTAAKWWHEHVDPAWSSRRAEALALLAQAEELARIVNLVGMEALSATQRWTLETAALVREGVLQQSALDDADSFCSPAKQFLLVSLMLEIHREGADLLGAGVPVQELLKLPVISRARRYKSLYRSDETEKLAGCRDEIHAAFDTLRKEYARPMEKIA